MSLKVPIISVVIGEGVYGQYLASNVGQGMVFLNIHIYVALISTFIGSVVDIGVNWLAKEHPVLGGLSTVESSS